MCTGDDELRADIGGEGMSRTKTLKERVDQYAEEHMAAYEEWTHGGIVDMWLHEGKEAIVCIRYEDGQYWHYEETQEGLKWW